MLNIRYQCFVRASDHDIHQTLRVMSQEQDSEGLESGEGERLTLAVSR